MPLASFVNGFLRLSTLMTGLTSGWMTGLTNDRCAMDDL